MFLLRPSVRQSVCLLSRTGILLKKRIENKRDACERSSRVRTDVIARVGFVPKASERDTAIVPFPSPSFYFPSLS